MPHITFIHGILNKPPKDELLRMWKSALASASSPFDLDAAGVSCDMVYWADVLYETPDPITMHESEAPEEQALEFAPEGEFRIQASSATTDEERAWLAAFRQRLGVEEDGNLTLGDEGLDAVNGTMAHELERIPLPWPIKKTFMGAFLRDVHHYLFNEEFSPRTGVTYRVQDEIRKRFVKAVDVGKQKSGPHIVVSHSMGTVIAYDCLKRVPNCPSVDHFITLGSPLGIDEVQDRLHPEWTRDDGFPSDRLKGNWMNFFDPFDVVSRLDPYLASDYRNHGVPVIEDTKQRNNGRTPHDIGGYMRGEHVCGAIQALLE